METRAYILQLIDHGTGPAALLGFVLMPHDDGDAPPVGAQGWVWTTTHPDRVISGEVDTGHDLAVRMPDSDDEICIPETPLSAALDNPYLLEAVRSLLGRPNASPEEPRFCETAAAGFAALLGAWTEQTVQANLSFPRGLPCITLTFAERPRSAPRRPASPHNDVWL